MILLSEMDYDQFEEECGESLSVEYHEPLSVLETDHLVI